MYDDAPRPPTGIPLDNRSTFPFLFSPNSFYSHELSQNRTRVFLPFSFFLFPPNNLSICTDIVVVVAREKRYEKLTSTDSNERAERVGSRLGRCPRDSLLFGRRFIFK